MYVYIRVYMYVCTHIYDRVRDDYRTQLRHTSRKAGQLGLLNNNNNNTKNNLSLSAPGTGYVTLKDSTAPYVKERWLSSFGLLCIYCLRIYMINGWYIVTYGLGIYILNLCIGFLSPASDPAAEGSRECLCAWACVWGGGVWVGVYRITYTYVRLCVSVCQSSKVIPVLSFAECSREC